MELRWNGNVLEQRESTVFIGEDAPWRPVPRVEHPEREPRGLSGRPLCQKCGTEQEPDDEIRSLFECPDGLLPDGPTCPRCDEDRVPSGIDGGTWIHKRAGYETTTRILADKAQAEENLNAPMKPVGELFGMPVVEIPESRMNAGFRVAREIAQWLQGQMRDRAIRRIDQVEKEAKGIRD